MRDEIFLVTGGAGFIGTNLCLTLLKKGKKVIAIDSLITANPSNARLLSQQKNCLFIKHDITKPFPKKLVNITRLRSIFHLACPTGVPNIEKLCQEMLLTCSIGTQNVLALALRQKAKLLFTSSSEIYGNPEKFPQDEGYTGNVDPTGARAPYEEGKRFSESLVTMYVKKYNLDAKIVRLFNTYGPYMSFDDTRVIPRFINTANNNKPLPVHGTGIQKRTFCYVDDTVSAIIRVLNKGKRGEVYNIGSNKEIKIIDLARQILKITKSSSIVKSINRPTHDHDSRRPLLTKINKLGWKPTTSLKQGLIKTLQWYNAI